MPLFSSPVNPPIVGFCRLRYNVTSMSMSWLAALTRQTFIDTAVVQGTTGDSSGKEQACLS